MLKSQCTDLKTRDEPMRGVLMEGTHVKRQAGMIYWHSWGEHAFDIRVMRRVLGIPEEHVSDKWFMDDNPDPQGSLQASMLQIQEALGEMSFAAAMAAHDQALDEGAEEELAAMLKRQEEAMAIKHPVTSGDNDDYPF